MTPDEDVRRAEQEPDLREIPKWARRYAHNRTLPIIANMVVFLAGFVAMGGLSYLTGRAHVTGRHTLAAVCVVLLSGFVVFWMWFSFAGGKRFERWVTERLYRGEGQVSVGPGPADIARGLTPIVGGVFGFCILAHVGLGFIGLTPIRYMQPVSALYVVPFLVYVGAQCGRGARGGTPLMSLWPVLYGLHAILLVAGAPIYFPGRFEALNMLVPTVGYGLVAALAGHLYSRLALRRLKALTRGPEAESRSTADQGSQSS